MAASGTTRSRSGAFKLYLFVWAVAAAAALAYLASLLTSPDFGKAGTKEAHGEQDQTMRLASRALSEIGTVRRTVGDMQRDLAGVKESLDQRETSDKQIQSRLSVLEERVTALTPSTANAPVAATTPPAAKQKAVEKSKAKDGKDKAAPAERSTSRLSRLEGEEKDGPEDPFSQPRVETGSIPAPQEEPEPPAAKAPPVAPTITFGVPVVTPSKGGASTFAVQVAAGSSVEALRNTWKQLQAKHEGLSALEPRFIAPKTEGGKYRLVAGPFGSKADAEKVCADMGVGRTGCFSTSFGGKPL